MWGNLRLWMVEHQLKNLKATRAHLEASLEIQNQSIKQIINQQEESQKKLNLVVKESKRIELESKKKVEAILNQQVGKSCEEALSWLRAYSSQAVQK